MNWVGRVGITSPPYEGRDVAIVYATNDMYIFNKKNFFSFLFFIREWEIRSIIDNHHVTRYYY